MSNSDEAEVSSFLFTNLGTHDDAHLLDRKDAFTEGEKWIIRQQIKTECLEQHSAQLIEQGMQQGVTKGYETGFQSGLQAADLEYEKKQTAIAAQEGYQKGLEEGFAAGQQKASAVMKAHLDYISHAVQQFDHDIAQLEKTLPQEILLLVTSLVEIIVSLSIGHTDSMIQTIQKTLAELPSLKKIGTVILLLHAEDKQDIEKCLSGHVLEQLTLTADADMARGDFRICAGSTHIDATLPVRLRRTLQSIGVPVEWINAPDHG